MPHTVIVQGTAPQTIVLGEEVVEFVDIGRQGPQGAKGTGVNAGGAAGQYLAKIDNTDYNTEWVDPPAAANAYSSLIGDTGTAAAVGPESVTFTGGDTSIVTAVTNGTDTVAIEVDIVDAGFY